MSPEDENEKINLIFVYGSVGRNALLYDRNYFQRIFSLVDVFVGRNLFYIFRTTRVMDEVERASLETSPLVYGVCSIC